MIPRKYKNIRITLYCLLVIIAAVIATYITLSALGFLDKHAYLSIAFAVGTPILIFFWAILLSWVSQAKSAYNQLNMDNLYYFNRKSYFFNGYMFQSYVRSIIKHKKNNGYIISFTGCSIDTSNSLIRNDAIAEYNSFLCEEIRNHYSINGKIKKGIVFGYDKGAFIIYTTGDEDEVNTTIKYFEEKIYEIARNHEFKLLIQPFFGVAKYDKSITTVANMENANLARHNSEKHYELTTYFNADLQYSFTSAESQEMMDALKNKEFVVYYQPKYNLNSKSFISSEALIRWNSPKYGLLPPSRFIAKAEAAGLIHDLDVFVFQNVCKDLKELKLRGKRLLPVSINFSLYEFYSPNFISYLLNTIDSNGIPRHLIEIEITETTTQVNAFLCISVIRKLRSEGIKILMDDFGVGYSNFNNLRKMPIDAIKIDKVFIDEIVTDSKTRNIVGFLINLGKVNGLEVIAEGVDNKEQVEILKKLKLDTIQGFFYSKPIPKKELEAFLSSNPFETRGGNN